MLTRMSPARAVANCVRIPFGAIGRPDTYYPVACLEAKGEQATSHFLHACGEFAVGPAYPLMPYDQSEILRPLTDCILEDAAYRSIEQWLAAEPAYIAWGH
ncbi:MAG: hypothetical protein JWN85_3807 [Gammaproteobacteria bacterium]|nr:hypothetical protein [Gammaproteobacteria bacterium]